MSASYPSHTGMNAISVGALDDLANAFNVSPKPINLVPNLTPTAECFQIIVKETATSLEDDGIYDATTMSEARFYIRTFKLTILLICFLIGLPVNVINMAVFGHQGLGDRVNLCLFALSLTDALFLLSSMTLYGENVGLFLSGGTIKADWSPALVNRNLIFLFGTGFISFVLSAIVACERCYCVTNPLKFHNVMRTRTMAIIIIAVYIVVLGGHFIVAYRFRIGCVYDPYEDTVTMVFVEGEFYRDHKQLIDQLDGILFGVIICGGVMVVVIAATTVTTIQLRKLVSWRTETSSSLSSREVALTKMLIRNSVFFIICATPACVIRVVQYFWSEIGLRGHDHDLFVLSVWVMESLLYVNVTFNFFIYYTMGTKYRETFWAMFERSVNQSGTKN